MFGVPIDRIRIVMGDTDRGQGFGSAGSRSLFTAGSAIRHASETRGRRPAASWPATRWRPRRPTSNMPRAMFRIAGTDRGIGLFELAGRQPDRRIFVDATSTVNGPSWPNGCHICEVEVDPETGAVEIVSYVSANDVGRVVNPMIVRGQLDGGAVQGIGQALGEHMVYDRETGQVDDRELMDYVMPRADIIRDFVHVLDQSIPCLNNPLGVKGVGELGTIGATPAVVNAVADALVRAGHGDGGRPAADAADAGDGAGRRCGSGGEHSLHTVVACHSFSVIAGLDPAIQGPRSTALAAPGSSGQARG